MPTQDAIAGDALFKARHLLTIVVKRDHDLVPGFLRMDFHECIGGCDGK
jgi:hypothetical protein